MSKNRSNLGFTLIELMIAVTIIIVLLALGALSYSFIQKRGRDSKRHSDLKVIQGALQQYYADSNRFPATTAELSSGTPKYLNQSYTDPKTNAAYTYNPTPSGCASTGSSSCTSYCLIATMELNVSDRGCASAGGNDYGVTPP